MFALSALPAVVQGVGMFFLPRSPRYLMLRRQEVEAEVTLQKLRGTQCVQNEISAIRVSIASEKVHCYLQCMFKKKDWCILKSV